MMIAALLFGACGKEGAKPLPDSGFQVAFESHRVASEMTIGKTVSADITVKNVSPVTWPSKPDQKDRYAVNLSYHWLNKKGGMIVFEGLRTPLPHDLKPDESVVLKAAIQAPQKTGTYTLEITLLQELVAWFPEKGGAKLSLPVKVTEEMAVAAAGVAKAPVKKIDAAARPLVAAKAEDKKSFPSKPGGKPQREEKETAKLPFKNNVDNGVATKANKPVRSSNRQSGLWFVQVGSYPDKKTADALANKLKEKGYDTFVENAEVQGKERHRVRVGRVGSRAEAVELQQALKGKENLSRTMIAKQ